MTDQCQVITGISESGTTYPLDKMQAHTDRLLHKAISIFLFDTYGRTLFQRRAATKYHAEGLWANSCCSHPAWGETDRACAARRLNEELGVTAELKFVGRVTYETPVGDLFEREDVAIFVGQLDKAPDRASWNAREVDSVAWVSWRDALSFALDEGFPLAPWTRLYLRDGAIRDLLQRQMV